MSSSLVPYEFQIINWYTTDLVWNADDSDDTASSNDGECEGEGGLQRRKECISKHVIKLFGVDVKGKSISVSVLGFTPHFYVKVAHKWSQRDINSLKKVITQKMGKNGSALTAVKAIRKKDFWGFSNGEMFWFLRLEFHNHRGMKSAARIITRLPFAISGQRKFKLYESNIEPFLRFAHIHNIQPAGWVTVPKTSESAEVLPSKCEIDIQTHWKNVTPMEKDAIAPLLVASFDLECTSSDGDFPVAVKNYRKASTDVFNIYHDKIKKKFDEYDIKIFITRYVCDLFGTGAIKSKEPITHANLENLLLPHLDHLCAIVRGERDLIDNEFIMIFDDHFYLEDKRSKKTIYGNDKELEQARLEGLENKLSKKGPAYVKLFHEKKSKGLTTTAIRKYMHACLSNCFEEFGDIRKQYKDVEDSLEHLIKLLFGDKDGIISALTRYMNSFMPPLEGDEIIQIGTTYHRYGESNVHKKVMFSLGSCDDIEGIEVIACDSEQEMLMRWAEMVESTDPDLLTGYNIFGFDFQYLHLRSKELGCDQKFRHILSRLKQVDDPYVKIGTYKEAKLSSSALGDNLMKYIDMEGRTHVDLMKVVQRDHKLDSYKLDSVANHFMSMNKHDVSPQDIFKLYKGNASDRAVIADYCIQDCALCNKLMMKLEIIANNVGMANVCSVPMSWIFMRGQGVKIFSLVAKECKKDGFIIPVVRLPDSKKKRIDVVDETDEPQSDEENNVIDADSDEENELDDEAGYEGAIVLEPKTGIYIDTPVSVLDYASLYPSSMISENISHDAIVLDAKYDNLPGVVYEDIPYDIYEVDGDEKRKVGEKVCRFVQPPGDEKGVIPNILMHLLKQRKITRKKIGLKRVEYADGRHLDGFYNKDTHVLVELDGSSHDIPPESIASISDVYDNFQKAVLDGLQLAYKVTANSLYGQLGSRMSPLFLKDLAACTTATGRKMILLAKEFLEQEYNANIVYGDTDSLMISFPDQLKTNEGKLLGKEAIQKSIDLGIEASNRIKPLLKHPHDLEYEKVFYPFILFSKKRYCANKYEFDTTKFKQNSMGIVLKRRDNANIVKHIYGGVIDIILNKHDIQLSIEFLQQSLNELVAGKFPLEELVITKTLKAHYKDPDKIAHKMLADRIKERTPGNAPQANDRIPFVYVRVEEKKKVKLLQGERIEHPDFIRERKLKPDYAFYLTNQVMNPVLQLYALVLDQLKGYKKNDGYWEEVRKDLERKGRTAKYTKEKIQDMREDEVQKILFDPILKKLECDRQGQRQLTEFW